MVEKWAAFTVKEKMTGVTSVKRIQLLSQGQWTFKQM